MLTLFGSSAGRRSGTTLSRLIKTLPYEAKRTYYSENSNKNIIKIFESSKIPKELTTLIREDDKMEFMVTQDSDNSDFNRYHPREQKIAVRKDTYPSHIVHECMHATSHLLQARASNAQIALSRMQGAFGGAAIMCDEVWAVYFEYRSRGADNELAAKMAAAAIHRYQNHHNLGKTGQMSAASDLLGVGENSKYYQEHLRFISEDGGREHLARELLASIQTGNDYSRQIAEALEKFESSGNER